MSDIRVTKKLVNTIRIVMAVLVKEDDNWSLNKTGREKKLKY